MRVATLGDGRVGVVEGSKVYPLPGFEGSKAGQISAMRRLIEVMDAGEWGFTGPKSDPLSLDQVSFLPPVPDPGKILAAPVNYIDHQIEMNEDVQVSGLGLFLKSPSSIVGHGGEVELPYTDRRFDFEGEVAVVIGRRARKVSAADALEHVFGFTPLMDMTMRGSEDRSTRKSFETFTPMGPWIVTLDEVDQIGNLDFTCRVNDQVRQDANTSDLIWGFAELVAYASSITTLNPGDIITSGTPAGVGPVVDGDVIKLDVQGVEAALTVKVTSRHAVLCPTTGGASGSGL
ncbi:hypothetical protein NLS1_31110 [Nocardioides sp. LS1]|nr:hypothetical protein NLS1_31110 [Nocardioides sp. LS1]